MLDNGKLAAERAMKKVALHEKLVLTVCFLLATVFLVPLFFSLHWIALATSLIGSLSSAFAMAFFFWNRPVNLVNRYFERRATDAACAELKRLQIDYLQSYMKFNYKDCKVSLLVADETKST